MQLRLETKKKLFRHYRCEFQDILDGLANFWINSTPWITILSFRAIVIVYVVCYSLLSSNLKSEYILAAKDIGIVTDETGGSKACWWIPLNKVTAKIFRCCRGVPVITGFMAPISMDTLQHWAEVVRYTATIIASCINASRG